MAQNLDILENLATGDDSDNSVVPMHNVQIVTEPQNAITEQNEPTPVTSRSNEPTPGTSRSTEPTPGTSRSNEPTPGTSRSTEPTPGTSRSNEPVPGTFGSVKRSSSSASIDSNPDSPKALKIDPENHPHLNIAHVTDFLPDFPTKPPPWNLVPVTNASDGPTIGDALLATIDSCKELFQNKKTVTSPMILPEIVKGSRAMRQPISTGRSSETVKDGVDIVSKCLELGMVHILEKIFLALPIRSILTCRQVCKDWQKVNTLIYQPTGSRLKNLVDRKIMREWKKNDPFVQSVIVHGFNNAGDIVGDTEHIFISGKSSERHLILVLDSKNMAALHALDIQCHLTRSANEVEAVGSSHLDIQMIRLGLNKKFLVAMVVHSFGGKEMYAALIWNRAKILEPGPPLIFIRRNPGPSYSPYHIKSAIWKPVMTATTIFLPIQSNRHNNIIEEVIFSEWNMEDGVFIGNLSKRHTCQNFRTQHVEFFLDLPRGQVVIVEVYEEGSVICIVNLRDDVIKWRMRNIRRFRPQVRGIGSDYLAIYWMGRPDAGLRVYSLINYACKQTIYIGHELFYPYEVQVSGDRVAVMGFKIRTSTHPGLVYDILIYDGKTGEQIMEVGKALGVRLSGSFLLEKERIVVQLCQGPVLSARFWK